MTNKTLKKLITELDVNKNTNDAIEAKIVEIQKDCTHSLSESHWDTLMRNQGQICKKCNIYIYFVKTAEQAKKTLANKTLIGYDGKTIRAPNKNPTDEEIKAEMGYFELFGSPRLIQDQRTNLILIFNR